MRTYEVYRHRDLVARVRVLDSGHIGWAYGHEQGDWHGYWWFNDVKLTLEQVLLAYPDPQEVVFAEFTLRRCDND